MADAPQKPTRKRRRWLIFALLLVISWWSWPRVDTRFVGIWEWHSDRAYFARFYGTGRGEWFSPTEEGTKAFTWRVDSSGLHTNPQSESRFLSSANQWIREHLMGQEPAISSTYRILGVGQDVIELQEVDYGGLSIMRRIPE